MADVTGIIGDQQVELNNAATEATLKQLLAQTKLMAQKMGVSAAQQARAEKEMEKFYKQIDKTNGALKAQKKEREDEAKSIEAANRARAREDALRERTAMVTTTFFKGLGAAADGLENFITKVTATMSSVANMGNSFAGAASTFNNIPIIGGMLGSVFGAVGGAGDKVLNTFKTVSSVGANFGGSIREMVSSASRAGLTMDQFAGMITKNSEGLALLGGNTTEGAKRVVNFTQALRKSGVQDDLARLGFTAEEIANGMASFAGRMSKAGLTRGMSDAEIAKVSGEYLKNLDAISRLTGKNKDALQAEADARMADSQYRLMLAKLDPEGAKNLEILMKSIPKEHQAGIKEILATGNAVSEQAQAAMYYMNQTGQNAMQLGQAMRASGTLTREQMFQFDESRKQEAKILQEQARAGQGVISVLGMYGDSVQQSMTVGILDAAQQKTLRETLSQQEKELVEQKRKQQDSLDPAKLVEAQKVLANTSNEFNVMLAQYLPQLMQAFGQLMHVINTYVVPAFQFIMTHFKELAIAIFAVKAGLMALGAIVKTMEFINTFKALGKTPGATPANPMFTKDIGGGKGGGLFDGFPTEKDGAKGKGRFGGLMDKLKGGGGLVKGLGAVGALASGAMLVSEMSDINEQQASGKITQAQATEQKGGAVGGAIGGGGGALAGAAAGAAIGSMVPVVGTVIGGVIGAGLGGWLGSKGGESIGSNIAKSGFIESAGAKITDAYKTTTTFLGNGFTAIKDKVTESLPVLREKFGELTDNLGSMFNTMKDKFAETFPNLTAGLKKIGDGLGKAYDYVAEKTVGAVNAVKTTVKNITKPTTATTTAKAPAAATTTTTAPTVPAGSGINYGATSENLLVQFAKSQGKIKDPNQTGTGSAAQSIPSEADKQKAAEDAVRRARDAADKQKEETEIRSPGTVPNQDTPSTLLAELNNKMAELIKLTAQLNTNTYNTAVAARSMTNDLFKAV